MRRKGGGRRARWGVGVGGLAGVREQNHPVLGVLGVLLQVGEPGPREMASRSQPGSSRLAQGSKQP